MDKNTDVSNFVLYIAVVGKATNGFSSYYHIQERIEKNMGVDLPAIEQLYKYHL